MKQIKLTSSEKRIYEIMTDAISQKNKITVSELAKRSGVASSSVVKLAHKLGYPGWNEMFYTCCNNHADIISLSFQDFDFLNDEEMNGYIKIICELLKQNKEAKIAVCAIGDCEISSNYFQEKLWSRGFTVIPFEYIYQYNEDNSSLSGIVFLINESGIVLLEGCMIAKNKNFTVVSITSNCISPLATHSHLTIELKNQKSSIKEYSPNFFTARVLMFIELIFAIYDEIESNNI